MTKTLNISLLFILCVGCILLGYGIFGVTVNNKNDEISNLNTQNTILIQRLDELTANNGDLNAEIEQKNLIIQEKEQTIENVKAEKNKYLEKISELEASGEDKNSEIATYQAKVIECNQTIAQCQNDITSLTNSIAELTANLSIANARIDELVLQLNAGYELFQKVVSGEITEIKAEDFGEITEIKPYSFYGCENLLSVEMPDTITKVGTYGFYNCRNLKNVKLSESLVTIGANSFTNSRITVLNLPNSVEKLFAIIAYPCTLPSSSNTYPSR